MRIDPALAALVGDPSPISEGAEEAAAWSRGPQGRAWSAELAEYGAGAELASCIRLSGLNRRAEAQAFARAVLGDAMVMLHKAWLGLYPKRHFTNGVLHSLTLAASGRASISLALIDGAAWRAARTPGAGRLVAFQPGELHATVMAGGGQALLLRNGSHDPARARIEAEPLSLAAGISYACDGERETLALERIDGCLVTLRLHRRSTGSTPARQYDVATGDLVHQAAGEQQDSRAEMIMALLRAMDRSDAAPVVAELAREGETGARWQALRECLALDSAAGFAELLRVAEAGDDPLSAPARVLVDRLANSHPAFTAAREAALCPA